MKYLLHIWIALFYLGLGALVGFSLACQTINYKLGQEATQHRLEVQYDAGD